MFLLDTNILSELIRRAPDPLLMQRWNSGKPGEFYTTVVCVMELRFGAAKAVRPGATWGRIERRILPHCTVLPFTLEDALRAGEVQATLARSNLTLEWRDVMIAAVALRHDFTLVTRNTGHFQRIIGLRTENWFE
jgi:predicted nucleic acid-binding protein